MNHVEIAMDTTTRNKQIAEYRFFQVSKNTRVYVIATRLIISVPSILCFIDLRVDVIYMFFPSILCLVWLLDQDI
jgi:hypothetical protein